MVNKITMVSIDLNTVAAIGSGLIALVGGGAVAKVAAPALKKLGQLEQILKDADADVQASSKVAEDLQTLIQGAQNGSISAAAMVSIQNDAKAAAAAFAKTVSDSKALIA
jgi:hypothetical protein